MDKEMSASMVLAVVVIASFAIDRIVTALLFLLSFMGWWTRVIPDATVLEPGPARANAEKKQRLVYFLLAGILGIIVVAVFGKVRLLHAMGFKDARAIVDILLTGLLLMGGAERIGQLIDLPGLSGGAKPEPRPLEVSGTLKLEETRKAA